jgi:hypothetical protein
MELDQGSLNDRRVESPECCVSAILYDEPRSRDLALALCDQLQARFWRDLDFEFTWWNLRFLADPHIAWSAAQAVSAADVIVFSLQDQVGLAGDIKGWIETWLPDRHGRTGALATLTLAPAEVLKHSPASVSFLESVAQRAGMDFLPLAASAAIAKPALRWPVFPPIPAPSNWGINE